jgi:CBS domain-containing protein
MKPLPRTVGDIMSRDVVTVTETQSLEFLPETMHLFRFRHLPVVDDNKLVGLISERDLLRVAASSLLPAAHEQTRYLTTKFKVSDIMTRDVRVVSATTPLAEAAGLMETKKLGCLPVVDDDNRLLGIVTEADFVTLARRMLQS